ncbi:uncharacterized protein LOC114307598 [Camellia sinensis]|uniref:uncharacterized protein LOC114307598 n=1 Tax=Camellia sinensis TaxID=4442 RepID=UPI001036CAB7|nr:uncharacterized protein LOC114307598 [Camellia sinensis]
MEDAKDWGPRLFRFINAWTLRPQFLSVIKRSWEESAVFGWASYVIFSKLKALRMALKTWNLKVFGNVQHKLKKAEEELHSLDLCVEYRELDDGEKSRRKVLKGEVWLWRKRDEWLWLQKSRMPWALKGDRNTRFFHIMATSQQSKNLINTLFMDEVNYDEPASIKRDWLNLSLSLQKKKYGLQYKGVMEFHRHGKLTNGITSSFITLIPQKDCPESLADYRPISLIGSLYKILSKVLASRVKKVTPKVVSNV